MGRENVEIVRAIIPPPEIDLAEVFRDDEQFEAIAQGLAHLAHPELETVAVWREGRTYAGIEGLRELWLDWLEPWATYYSKLDEIIDLGDRVLVLARDRGRRPDMDLDVELSSGSLWEIRDEQIARVEFFRDRAEARAAAGLSDESRVD